MNAGKRRRTVRRYRVRRIREQRSLKTPDDESVGVAANIVQVFGFGIALMFGLRIINVYVQAMYWFSIMALGLAFVGAYLGAHGSRKKMTKFIWIIAILLLVMTTMYALFYGGLS